MQAENLKIRCSALGNICHGLKLGQPVAFTESESERWAKFQAITKESSSKDYLALKEKFDRIQKGELEQCQLTTGAKTYIREQHYNNFFDFEGSFSTKETKKGNEVEMRGIRQICEYMGYKGSKFIQRNELWLQNDFIQGTPDLINPVGLDCKAPFKPKGLKLFNDDKDRDDPMYRWQCKGYSWLTLKDKWYLARILMSCPEHLLNGVIWSLWEESKEEGRPTEDFKQSVVDMYDFESRYSIQERTSVMVYDLTDHDILIMKKAVELSREYWEELNKEATEKRNIKFEL